MKDLLHCFTEVWVSGEREDQTDVLRLLGKLNSNWEANKRRKYNNLILKTVPEDEKPKYLKDLAAIYGLSDSKTDFNGLMPYCDDELQENGCFRFMTLTEDFPNYTLLNEIAKQEQLNIYYRASNDHTGWYESNDVNGTFFPEKYVIIENQEVEFADYDRAFDIACRYLGDEDDISEFAFELRNSDSFTASHDEEYYCRIDSLFATASREHTMEYSQYVPSFQTVECFVRGEYENLEHFFNRLNLREEHPFADNKDLRNLGDLAKVYGINSEDTACCYIDFCEDHVDFGDGFYFVCISEDPRDSLDLLRQIAEAEKLSLFSRMNDSDFTPACTDTDTDSPCLYIFGIRTDKGRLMGSYLEAMHYASLYSADFDPEQFATQNQTCIYDRGDRYCYIQPYNYTKELMLGCMKRTHATGIHLTQKTKDEPASMITMPNTALSDSTIMLEI